MTALAPVLMVQGTASSAGKSTLVAGLCRLMARQGLRVAPFKAQNMSNNAAVCPEGGEIGRAQYAQAVASRAVPTVDMNPVLLKPQGGACQVIVRGRLTGVLTAAEYFGGRRGDLWPVVAESLARLRTSYDLVIVEGAGSPAEVNLRHRDLANMAVALHADADVLLVGDIDRGGVFAALLGTWEWLPEAERRLVKGFVLNKFRGDAALLSPAPELLTTRTGVPVLGVLPFLDDLALPDEDSASLQPRAGAESMVEIAVVLLPHISNYDEFRLLEREPGTRLRHVTRPEEMRAPDLVVLPGTKATIPDLRWLHDRGLAGRIRWLCQATHTPVLGICGGFQMLGATVRDPQGLESEQKESPGLGLFDLETTLGGDKRLARVQGQVASVPGIWACMAGAAVTGYEIHLGRTAGTAYPPLLTLDPAEPDGAVSSDGQVAGTYVHGLFEEAEPRHRLLAALAAARGFAWTPSPTPEPDVYDRLADAVAEHVSLSKGSFSPPLAALLPG